MTMTGVLFLFIWVAALLLLFDGACDFAVLKSVYAWLKKMKEQKDAKKREASPAILVEALPKCPMDSLPDIANRSLEERITSWQNAVDSGKYRSWAPTHDEASAWTVVEYWKNTEYTLPIDPEFTAELNRIKECYGLLDAMRVAGAYPQGCCYLASLYYWAYKRVLDLQQTAKTLLALQEMSDNVHLASQTESVLTIDDVHAAINGVVKTYFEDELVELTKLALVELSKTYRAQTKDVPELPVHTTTPEEIEGLKLLIDNLLSGSRGKKPVLISEI